MNLNGNLPQRRDRPKIELGENPQALDPDQLDDWTRALRVPRAQLCAAIQVVGNDLIDVHAYLLRNDLRADLKGDEQSI